MQTTKVFLAERAAWREMRYRCIDEKNAAYKYYGGRGIKVCKRWLNSFDNFLKDMGKKPTPKHTLDRINNDKDYKPSNCAWRTMKEQCRNRRSNRWVLFNGMNKTLAEWAECFGVTQNALSTCLLRRSFKDAYSFYMLTPKKRKESAIKYRGINRKDNVWIEYNGEKKTQQQWADHFGVHESNLFSNKKRTPIETIEHYKKHGKRKFVMVTYLGKTQGTAAWAKELNIDRKKLWGMIRTTPFNQIYKTYKNAI